jgi:hypothetical protein
MSVLGNIHFLFQYFVLVGGISENPVSSFFEPTHVSSSSQRGLERNTWVSLSEIITQLEEEDKHSVYRIIDSMLTRTKFQDFFQKNLPAAQ